MKPATHLQLLPSEAPGAARAAAAGLDEDLALRACAGDVSAWAEVYARHYPQLLGVVGLLGTAGCPLPKQIDTGDTGDCGDPTRAAAIPATRTAATGSPIR